jgi:glycine/D-amino acid oxidase-like deaminating enzyme
MCASDGRPLIGRVPVEGAGPNTPAGGAPMREAYVLTGLASSGFMRGPMAAYLLAAAMDGDADAERRLAPASPSRFLDRAGPMCSTAT